MRRGAVVGVALVVLAALAVGIYIIYTNPEAPPPEQTVQEPAPETGGEAEAPEEPQEEGIARDRIDKVVVAEEPNSAAAVTRLETGDLDLYGFSITDAELASRIKASEALQYKESFGSYSELTFNPVGPTFENGRFNPFSNRKIREAMNWLIDREYIAEDIYGGLAVPKWVPIPRAFPDYARMADVVRQIEINYAYDPQKAEQIITQEMESMGAELRDGTWHYDGEPVTLIFLIRVEDERREVGDYVATELEKLGFVVDRQYKNSADASTCWIRSNPAGGCFHIYTGGWVTTVVSRDEGDNFSFFYTARGLSSPLWQAYTPSEEFDEVSERLERRNFSSIEERNELFRRALKLAMEDSARVWVVDRLGISPHRADVGVAADLAGGINGSWLWAHTIQYEDEAGGTIDLAMPSLLPEPWNPVAGSNWIYDMMLIRGTSDVPTLWDPYTGLHHPQRLERAEVYIKEGLPVTKTLDWVDLQFVEEIQVPEDAWVDWDAEAQEWITAGEQSPEGLTANRKVVLRYPEGLDEIQWHDGSTFDLADIMLRMILTFDRAKEESALFDEAYVPEFETFLKDFRGWRIAQEDPLVLEWYSDLFYLDAEWNAYAASWEMWPYYGFGIGAWHTLTLGILAEQDQELAFSADKADQLEVEWTSLISGPSLKILEEKLQQVQDGRSIPYRPTLGPYVTDAEAEERWSHLDSWYEEKGHFWVGNGPLYLESLDTTAKVVELKRFEQFPDPADKWARFQDPRYASAEVAGPSTVTIGDEASFEVKVTYEGAPYPTEDIDFVKYLLFDARGELALVGQAEAAEDGQWEITFTPEQMAQLEAGSHRLEVIVAPIPVAKPTFASLEFVASP